MSHDIHSPLPASLQGKKRVLVAGLGRSGVAAAALLGRCGLTPTVMDSRSESDLAATLGELPAGTRFVPQTAAERELEQADLLVLSPGIDARREPFASAMAGGVETISEIELGWRFVESPVVAVTGSNGKSTVTALIGALLEGAGLDARVCGNIGRPLCEALALQTAATRFVVEVSSFQLERTTSFAPQVAVLLNITPDHQDRYASTEDYAAAKENLFAHQKPTDLALVCHDDAGARRLAERLEARRNGPRVVHIHTDEQGLTGEKDGAGIRDGRIELRLGGRLHALAAVTDIPLPGPHNIINAATSLAAAACTGAPPERLAGSLRRFDGLPHRLQRVATHDGVTFVDDSKATNVESARVALRSFAAGTVLVILGGRDKGGDFARLAEELRLQARKVFVVGEAAPRIQAALAGELPESLPVVILPGLAEAVPAAAAEARAGDTVLLTPACASFDQYENFEARGRHFEALAREWIAAARGDVRGA